MKHQKFLIWILKTLFSFKQGIFMIFTRNFNAFWGFYHVPMSVLVHKLDIATLGNIDANDGIK